MREFVAVEWDRARRALDSVIPGARPLAGVDRWA